MGGYTRGHAPPRRRRGRPALRRRRGGPRRAVVWRQRRGRGGRRGAGVLRRRAGDGRPRRVRRLPGGGPPRGRSGGHRLRLPCPAGVPPRPLHRPPSLRGGLPVRHRAGGRGRTELGVGPARVDGLGGRVRAGHRVGGRRRPGHGGAGTATHRLGRQGGPGLPAGAVARRPSAGRRVGVATARFGEPPRLVGERRAGGVLPRRHPGNDRRPSPRPRRHPVRGRLRAVPTDGRRTHRDRLSGAPGVDPAAAGRRADQLANSQIAGTVRRG